MKAIKLTITILFTSLLLIACMAKEPMQLVNEGEDDYGIGGTGIVGSVTGFGSIFVNGVEIETDAQTTIRVDEQPVQEHQFAIGETVEVLARDDAQFSNAASINIRHEIIGPVTHWDWSAHRMTIFGQVIQLSDASGTWLPGQAVVVSGYRDPQGVIQARRIETAFDNKFLLRGEAEDIRRQLAESGYQLDAKNQLDDFSGSIKIQGRLQQNMLNIERISRQALLPYRNLKHWKIEGFTEHYRELWPALDSLADDSGHSLQFELSIGDAGKVTVQAMDSSKLRRGAQQYHAPEQQNGFGQKGNRPPAIRSGVKGHR
jgi:hypothetical protein